MSPEASGAAALRAVELEKTFNPREFEDRIYALWTEGKYFSPSESTGSSDIPDGERPFVIVIPPPNVTGVLHLGHGLNNSIQDILVRYYRMKGVPTLWVPGTDHAGIATQNVVERKLRAEGKSREQMGREAFVEETEKVSEDHKSTIRRQLQKIGASCDWSRERFTLDDGLSRAVREAFVGLYERGLIYRGSYLVNWCTSCGTAISDDEVEHKEINGAIYHYSYPLSEGSGSIVVATTRPETMLGDTAVAVHPEDERYLHLVGKEVDLPLTGRRIPIVADTYVDREFGSGAVKVTPAHDINDREIGLRHDLEVINILNPDGSLADTVPERYRGKTVKEARRLVVEDLKEAGVYLHDEHHTHQVGHCYRCNTAVEPYMSEQWFVKMRPLADKALLAAEKGEIEFFPGRWVNTYSHWMREIRDWCISRQLWWGHRIPVWYCNDCGKMTVKREDPTECEHCGGVNIRQDEDVLDTWFSSGLWPFSTLGWPDKTPDLDRFFPTTTLVTGYDIIFFWIARMVMMSLEFMGQVPFRDIYITSLVRDKHGRKMSKSLGNGIDPLEVVDEYGADSLKFTLAFLSAQGQDIPLDKNTFAIGSKFANKIWNATRYLLMNLEGRRLLSLADIELRPLDRWIYHRLNEAAGAMAASMKSYRFNDAAHAVYEFFWNDFCDWYIEASKLSLYSEDENERDRAVSLLMGLLEESLRLMHPLLPFVTEEIYQKLPAIPDSHGSAALIAAPYPCPEAEREDAATAALFGAVQELVTLVRTLRSEFTVPPQNRVVLEVRCDSGLAATSFFEDHKALIASLVGASELRVVDRVGNTAEAEGAAGKGNSDRPSTAVATVGTGFEAWVDLKDAVDVVAVTQRMQKELEKQRALFERTDKKLLSSGFIEKADPAVVEKEREKHGELARKIEKMEKNLASLKD
ncbi:MAG: valine--tRNA ligase [Spirochaetia bacterium]